MDKKFYLYYTKKNKFEIRQYNIRGVPGLVTGVQNDGIS